MKLIRRDSTKLTHIFLDMDDVLNCFTMSALAYVGCNVEIYNNAVYNPKFGWDIVKAVNSLHPTKQFTEATFWKAIDRRFWATIPKSTECDWLLGVCAELVGRENVCILSAPTLDPDCLAGKLDWIYRYMPKWLHRQFLFGPRKYFCAKRDALLIDDSDENIRLFCLHGGQGISMPRPWNKFEYINCPKGHVSDWLRILFRCGEL